MLEGGKHGARARKQPTLPKAPTGCLLETAGSNPEEDRTRCAVRSRPLIKGGLLVCPHLPQGHFRVATGVDTARPGIKGLLGLSGRRDVSYSRDLV